MAKAGGKDSTSWPPDGLPLVEALSIVLPEAWAAYLAVGRAVVRAGARAGVTDDELSRLVTDHKFATLDLQLELLHFIEREPYELWGRPYSLFEDARHIQPVAIEAMTTFTPRLGEAGGRGIATLFDLRLRRKAEEGASTTKEWIAAKLDELEAAKVVNDRMGITAVAKLLETEVFRVAALPGSKLKPAKWPHLKNLLRNLGLWPRRRA